MKRFEDFNLKKTTLDWIHVSDFSAPTPIQEDVIPYALKGKDVIGLSHTGTGKTHAYLIPIMEMIDPSDDHVQVVITAPTRELAMQIYDKTITMNELYPDLKVALYIGGKDRNKDLIQLTKNQPQIVIGTPGRIKDLFLDEGLLRLEKAKMLVVDEADMTLEYGFIDDIDAFAGRMQEEMQMLCFSATMPEQLKPFIKKYMHHPLTIKIDDDERFEPNIDHILVPCYHRSFTDTILRILPGFQPYICLIFTNTREMAETIAEDLRNNQIACVEIHGNLESRQRKKALKELASGQVTYVVATDLAARGIDIPTVSHVISCGFPSELDFYIHRAGRASRAGNKGTCFALYHEEDHQAILSLMKKGIHFKHQRYHQNAWQTLSPYKQAKKKRKDPEMEKEISKLKTKKNLKVKPGYKKKQARAIQELERKKKRDFIRQKIKEEKKAMYKQRQISQGKKS